MNDPNHGAAVSLHDASIAVAIPFFAHVNIVNHLVVQDVDHCTGAACVSHHGDLRTLQVFDAIPQLVDAADENKAAEVPALVRRDVAGTSDDLQKIYYGRSID